MYTVVSSEALKLRKPRTGVAVLAVLVQVVVGGRLCGEPAISLHSHHVSLVQWTTCLLPVTRDPGSNPQGGTYVKPGFSC